METRTVRRSLAIAALAVSVAVLPMAPAVAQQDNAAIAINTKDGSSVFKFSFSIAREMNDVLDQTNGAVAVASCTECQTVAIAIQVVLVGSEPSIATPENIAIAYNIECTACETMASAFQYVFGTGGAVYFTPDGNRELARIRQAFHDLEKNAGSMTLDEIEAAVEDLVAQLLDVVSNELLLAGPPTTTPSASPSPSPTAEATATPTTDVSPSPTVSPSVDVSPSPTG